MFLERVISYPSFICSFVPTVPMIDRTGVSLSREREQVAFDLFLNILEKTRKKWIDRFSDSSLSYVENSLPYSTIILSFHLYLFILNRTVRKIFTYVEISYLGWRSLKFLHKNMWSIFFPWVFFITTASNSRR